jgi:hypothetical protein
MAAQVNRTTGRSTMDSSEASIGRAAVKGAIIGFFAVLALVSTILFAVAGVSLGVALAVGAYVGIWGGPGWGGMVAAQRRADQLADEERRAARTQRKGTDEPPHP